MPSNQNPNIFLSYSWANASIADEIDNDFNSIGIHFKRDIRDITYRGSIKEFMHQIGKTDFVLMIISDEYLRSESCMYEVMELLNTHEFEKRILPIIIDNARPVFKAQERLVYYDYWRDELKKAHQLKNTHPNQDYIDLVKKTNSINDCLDIFFQKIIDLNVSTYEKLKQENYRALLRIVGFNDKGLLEELVGISKITDLEEKDLALDKFLNIYPNNKHALFEKADLAHKTQQEKKCKSYLEEVIRVDPGFSGAHNNLAILLATKFSDYDLAMYHYKEAIRIEPSYFEAHYSLAILLTKNFSDYNAAKQHYEEAIRLNPLFHKAYTNLGLLLDEYFSDYVNAKYCYEQAIKIDPYYSNAFYNLAILLVNHFSDFEGAKQYYKEAIRVNPNYVDAHHNLAVLLAIHFSDYENARQSYEEAIKIDPNHADSHFNLALLLQNHFSDYYGARQHSKEAIRINPKDAEAHLNLAILLEIKFLDYAGAKHNYEEAIKIDSNYELAKNNLANLLKNHFQK